MEVAAIGLDPRLLLGDWRAGTLVNETISLTMVLVISVVGKLASIAVDKPEVGRLSEV